MSVFLYLDFSLSHTEFLVPCEFEIERLILLYYPCILSFAEEIFIRIFAALVLQEPANLG